MEGLTIHLAGLGGEHGIRVNAVRPGRIVTDKFREWLGEDPSSGRISARSRC
jgi:meso-butanediol dehydrogenase/(S,S)-butanediol dehydrogenase/diacetyl reductase